MEAVVVTGNHFRLDKSGQPFFPVGFNYDHDEYYRLLEDYWLDEWPKVANDFQAMRQLGSNVIRIHLQTGRFLAAPDTFCATALQQLDKLLALACTLGLRLHLVGLGCYHRHDVPGWYDQLDEQQRWQTQAFFWQTLARRYRGHPAIFCFDLMNEPTVPGRKRFDKGWLGPDFHGKCFVQFISLDGRQAPRQEIALRWTQLLCDSIRREDNTRLITIGLVDWSLDGMPQHSGFTPTVIAPLLDFVCAHVYPEYGKVEQAVAIARRFCIGKPLVLDETFPLRCTVAELQDFMQRMKPHAAGFLSFYTDFIAAPETAFHHEKNALMQEWLPAFMQSATSAS